MTNIPPQSVEDILEYYSVEVVPSLAAALTVDDRFPKEVLNEIRNSYTHLARANKLGSAHSDYLKELDGAYRHLKRTCIDCMKVCVFTLATRSERVVALLEEELRLPNNVYNSMSQLRDRRRDLSAYEGQHPTHEALLEYKALFNEYDQFYRSLDAEFSGETAEGRREARRARERKAERRSSWKGFLFGVLSSTLVALAISYGSGSWPFDRTTEGQSSGTSEAVEEPDTASETDG